ncbi:ureidoglycolate lyase [Azospirillum picis]|uniref:Ureidoglycolate lyase n=1 Tax=Azospirillum picis TaxID=488438 RepID=A0ABU0MLY0_9PROT|nr:ureidoglycolate lyase [Azospirillum picis]MBP2300509.1 ureidoglycolate lyase [Azospirillum picis]MDQ0534478.1 ureidoglycolate lyase [Azospirillum picis]
MSAPRIIPPVPLTAEAFAPFGTVLAAGGGRPSPVNDGRGVRYDAEHGLGFAGDPLPPVLALYRLTPSRLPFAVTAMEQHPLSTQTFVPMTGGRFLVVAARAGAGGAPDPETACAFIAGPDQAITYAGGVWHCPLVALDETADFAMMMWRAPDPDSDCRVVSLSVPLLVADHAAAT